MRDVACAGYVAGCNTLFFAQDSMGADSYSMANAQTHMMERLSFANDVGAKYASMLAFPCTAQQMSSGHLDTVMSVTTRLLPWEVTTATGGDHHSFPGGQKVFGEYQGKLNLRSVHFGEDMKAAGLRRHHATNPPFYPAPPSQLLTAHCTVCLRREPRLHLVIFALATALAHAHTRTRQSLGTQPLTPSQPPDQARLHQQRDVLHRPAPPVRPVHQELHEPRAGTGPLWVRGTTTPT